MIHTLICLSKDLLSIISTIKRVQTRNQCAFGFFLRVVYCLTVEMMQDVTCGWQSCFASMTMDVLAVCRILHA
jgi:hypothetical protein